MFHFLAEVREQVYETLKKHCTGYENANDIQKQYHSQSVSNNVNTQQNTKDVPNYPQGPPILQPQAGNRQKSVATNITGISGFASPLNVRRQQNMQGGMDGSGASSKNDAMALYARVDRSKKKKNRDSGGGSR